jgi:hypothetical protein
MELVQWIGLWPGAVLLRRFWVAYLFVNAAHILGIGLILGSILPLDLRLLGLFRWAPLAVLGPLLTRSAAAGVALAFLTGLWLFSVRPAHYLANAAFLSKLVLIALALTNVVLQHRNHHFRQALQTGQIHPSLRLAALVSALLWLSALIAGRWIGFL